MGKFCYWSWTIFKLNFIRCQQSTYIRKNIDSFKPWWRLITEEQEGYKMPKYWSSNIRTTLCLVNKGFTQLSVNFEVKRMEITVFQEADWVSLKCSLAISWARQNKFKWTADSMLQHLHWDPWIYHQLTFGPFRHISSHNGNRLCRAQGWKLIWCVEGVVTLKDIELRHLKAFLWRCHLLLFSIFIEYNGLHYIDIHMKELN